MVLSALAEGLDPSAAERVFGYCQATITRWLTGQASTLSSSMSAYTLNYIQTLSTEGSHQHPLSAWKELEGERPHERLGSTDRRSACFAF
jgi:hypothetical protein